MELFSEKVKKLHPWSNGLGVYVTTEAKEFGWSSGDHIKVSAIEDSDGEKIVIEKITV